MPFLYAKLSHIFCLFFQKLFIYCFYQLQNIAFICSIYTTVLLALQRYMAISRPLEYYVDNTTAAAGKLLGNRSPHFNVWNVFEQK